MPSPYEIGLEQNVSGIRPLRAHIRLLLRESGSNPVMKKTFGTV